jgi:hypothetical protein
MTISITSRQRIRQRAKFLCEYCHSSEEASTSLFTFDHAGLAGRLEAPVLQSGEESRHERL